MKTGAFALLDCLGFKGIWKHVSPDSVIGKLDSIEEWIGMGEWAKKLTFTTDNPNLISGKLILLSDTIAVSVTKNDDAKGLPGLIPIAFMVDLVEEIYTRFLVDKPHLLLRGCITYGEHLVSDRFIIGPAVDRAAEYEKLPNGAFVWLEPAAAKEYREYMSFMKAMSIPVYPDSSSEEAQKQLLDESRVLVDRLAGAVIRFAGLPNPIIDYNMPIKGGDRLPCALLNPLNACKDEKELVKRYDTFANQFASDRIDVLIKKSNTLEFLNLCKDETEKYFDRKHRFFEIVENSVQTRKATGNVDEKE
jgi:hypothetical protein